MRLLNMNNLRGYRQNNLAGMGCIGKGAFASVYAKPGEEVKEVMKVTADQLTYYYLCDQLWLDVRSEVESAFPRVIADEGEIGMSADLPVYAIRLERLYPIFREQRAKVMRYSREYIKFPSQNNDWHLKSIRFCESKANEGSEDASIFEALCYFISNYGGSLDISPRNFMQRADGTLVWNDVIFDSQAVARYNRRNPFH